MTWWPLPGLWEGAWPGCPPPPPDPPVFRFESRRWLSHRPPSSRLCLLWLDAMRWWCYHSNEAGVALINISWVRRRLIANLQCSADPFHQCPRLSSELGTSRHRQQQASSVASHTPLWSVKANCYRDMWKERWLCTYCGCQRFDWALRWKLIGLWVLSMRMYIHTYIVNSV